MIDYKSPLMSAALSLRSDVFVTEQATPIELEVDKYDEKALHLVAVINDQVVGTLRILACDGVFRIGRVAVCAAARKTGIGSRLMERAAEYAQHTGACEIVLNAQVPVTGFYRRLGYMEEGQIFNEAGIPHIRMRKRIS